MSGCQERLVPIGRQGCQGSQPFGRHAAALVVPPLLFLGRHPDPVLDRGIADRDEHPGLLVGAGGGRRGGHDRVLDRLRGTGSAENMRMLRRDAISDQKAVARSKAAAVGIFGR